MSTVTAEQAKNMRSGVNIEGTVERKGEPRTVNKKAGGTIDVCDAYLVDAEGGEIKLTLWGDDIAKVNDGNKLKITNGYTNSFKGEVSLTKGKFGQMEVIS
ncbi:DNA-binding protein [Nitrosopumilus sp. b1]|uniref:DNA-binding protein n=1 Tax=Nitrosopumilus sp. b1 TaxID=2109907 RepID=UPI000E2BD445|nr:DNA-binding protein [Nitrosopumilus sp. b1]RDJ31492.1 MAG: DNA-binding protein [Thermoproteota archaeon]KAF6242640.1 DNA-binding protein [Nitrosopumilus sp. b1]RDJ33733.1 MAG: DNA-binding protein [Thermoproteota archaeon]RDJ37154.1 MAG: DNA-binding protein [Thermoproteota archaeon]RDJ37313.1 MAG: DNA-binding protein [Thermoproteota archaeon]